MTRTDAAKQIAVIDKRINAARRAKDRNGENHLFLLRGWYQLLRDTANDHWSKTEHANAEAVIAKLEGRAA